MSNLINAIPGMASYMDADIDVEVKVGEPEEVAAAAEETANEAVEVETVDAEVQEDADAAEEMFARFDELDRMKAYVTKYGVDRAFLALNTYEGSLAAALVTLPSCESFDVTGNVSSPESIACVEGFKEAAKAVWEFIKRMAAKIKTFVVRIYEAVRSRLVGLNKTIGHYREVLGAREDDAEKIKDNKTKVYSLAALNKLGIRDIKDFVKMANDTMNRINSTVASITANKTIEGDTADWLKQTNEFISELKKKRSSADMVELSTIKWVEIKPMLDKASSICADVTSNKNTVDLLSAGADKIAAAAKQMETRGDDNAKEGAETARKIASALNKLSSAFSSVLSQEQWIASQMTRTAGLRLVHGSKKKA